MGTPSSTREDYWLHKGFFTASPIFLCCLCTKNSTRRKYRGPHQLVLTPTQKTPPHGEARRGWRLDLWKDGENSNLALVATNSRHSLVWCGKPSASLRPGTFAPDCGRARALANRGVDRHPIVRRIPAVFGAGPKSNYWRGGSTPGTQHIAFRHLVRTVWLLRAAP